MVWLQDTVRTSYTAPCPASASSCALGITPCHAGRAVAEGAWERFAMGFDAEAQNCRPEVTVPSMRWEIRVLQGSLRAGQTHTASSLLENDSQAKIKLKSNFSPSCERGHKSLNASSKPKQLFDEKYSPERRASTGTCSQARAES